MSIQEPGELPAVHEAWLPREHPLHRPRHGGRQATALVCALLFFAAPVLAWTFGARAAPLENRPQAEFPSITRGWGFFTGLSAWATDHLSFRQGAVHSVEALSQGLFGESARLGESTSGSPVGGDGGDDSDRDRRRRDLRMSMFPDVIHGKDGWMYLGHDASYKCVPEIGIDRVIAGLRRWRDVVEASGREFRLVIPPDKSTVYPEHMPDEFAGERCMTEARAEFWRRVPAATGAFDMRERLRTIAESDGEPIYTKRDTHWRHRGGVAMTRMLAESLRSGVTEDWQVRPSRRFQHNADIPDLLGREETWTVQGHSLAPDGGADNTRFVPSDFQQPLHLESEQRPGMITRPTRMVADSFAQFASPYMAAAFSDLTITHPDNAAERPRKVARTLAEGEVVIFELSERFVAGGRYPMLDPKVADRVGEYLAAHPVR
ncbi:hypothetical protein FHX42_004000 [Saccharopolyspora lacisalsi]|uniref:AlgX/AlgJ SGNH hydrolase-like domain-containing protein n=1 Tax=Halosaccharopolyspora lacisalsi TaxID=1000566 RepID=A0A839E5M0_9PSEU|nr:hypothetical protein [Halosaccharopolyspora lacisalsi]MBA8826621.1 hypothetical protein [Halosaccharopolyspora lacisalsi]